MRCRVRVLVGSTVGSNDTGQVRPSSAGQPGPGRGPINARRELASTVLISNQGLEGWEP